MFIVKDIEKYTPIIVKLAVGFYKKLRKPTIFDIDDLITEGIIVLAKKEREKGKLSEEEFKKLVVNAIWFRFRSIVHSSYNHKNGTVVQIINIDDVGEKDLITAVESPVRITDALTKEQLNYILYLLKDENYIEKTSNKTFKQSLKFIRKDLGMTSENERVLRKSIINFLLKSSQGD